MLSKSCCWFVMFRFCRRAYWAIFGSIRPLRGLGEETGCGVTDTFLNGDWGRTSVCWCYY
jgi:hypothetical protein